MKGTFTARNLAANDIKKIVDEVNKISHKAFGEEKDLIGRVYEYFLKEFVVNATKEEGEFYTPFYYIIKAFFSFNLKLIFSTYRIYVKDKYFCQF